MRTYRNRRRTRSHQPTIRIQPVTPRHYSSCCSGASLSGSFGRGRASKQIGASVQVFSPGFTSCIVAAFLITTMANRGTTTTKQRPSLLVSTSCVNLVLFVWPRLFMLLFAVACELNRTVGSVDVHPSDRPPLDVPFLVAPFNWAGIRGQIQIWPTSVSAGAIARTAATAIRQQGGSVYGRPALSHQQPLQQRLPWKGQLPIQPLRVRIRVSLEGGQPRETFYWGVHKFPPEFDGSTRLCELPRLGSMILNFTTKLGLITSEETMYFSTALHLWGHPTALIGRALSLQSAETGRVSCAPLRLVHVGGGEFATFKATFRSHIGGTLYLRTLNTNQFPSASGGAAGPQSDVSMATTLYSELYFVNNTHGRERLFWSVIPAEFDLAAGATGGAARPHTLSADLLDDGVVFAEEVSACARAQRASSNARDSTRPFVISCRHRSCAVYASAVAGPEGRGRAYRVLGGNQLQVQLDRWRPFEDASEHELFPAYVVLERPFRDASSGSTQFVPVACALLEEVVPRLLRANFGPSGIIQMFHESPFDPLLITFNLTGRISAPTQQQQQQQGSAAAPIVQGPHVASARERTDNTSGVEMVENVILNRRALHVGDRACPDAIQQPDEVFRPIGQPPFLIARSRTGTPDQHPASELGVKMGLTGAKMQQLWSRVGHIVDGSLSAFGVNSVSGRAVTLFGSTAGGVNASSPSPARTPPQNARSGNSRSSSDNISPRQWPSSMDTVSSRMEFDEASSRSSSYVEDEDDDAQLGRNPRTSNSLIIPVLRPIACNNLDFHTDLVVLKVRADFTTGDLRGFVLFSQLSASPNNEVFIDLSLCWATAGRNQSVTASLAWYLESGQRRTPALVNPWLTPRTAACSSQAPFRCAMGDLTGRHGAIQSPPPCERRQQLDSRVPPKRQRLRLRFTDLVLSLMGVTSIADSVLRFMVAGQGSTVATAVLRTID